MKRLTALFLCIVLLVSGTVFAQDNITSDGVAETVEAVETVKTAEETNLSYEIDMLSQLGILKSTKANSMITNQMMVTALEKILNNGTNVEKMYFESIDLNSPLYYGHFLAILIDVLGYSNYVEMFGYDKNDAYSYVLTAKRIGMECDTKISVDEPLTTDVFAYVLYDALVYVPLSEVSYIKDGNIYYEKEKEVTLLTKNMELTFVNGIVDGTDTVSRKNDGVQNTLSISSVWFKHNLKKDAFEYYGRNVDAIVDFENKEIKSIVVNEENETVKLLSADITDVDASVTRLSYQYKDAKKEKTIKLSPKANLVFNREVSTTYNRQDLLSENSAFTFVDNNNDKVYDVIIIEKYESVVVDTISSKRKTIVDSFGNVFDLEEYFDNGFKLYNKDGTEAPLTMLSRYHVLSYLKTKSGKIKHIVFSIDKANGIFEESREGIKFVTIDGIEYEVSSQYIKNQKNYDRIELGDNVTALLDVNGFVIDIRLNTNKNKAAYVFSQGNEKVSRYSFKMLKDDNTITHTPLAKQVVLDGVKMAPSKVFESAAFLKRGEFVPQLILYKLNSNGEIVNIDTAVKNSGLGKKGFDEFTLMYDSDTDGGELEDVTMGGKVVVGTKYVLDTRGKIFYINNSNEDYSMVIDQTGIGTSSLGMKFYNVDENYQPQYMVIHRNRTVGGWVDYWGDLLMIDNFKKVVTPEGEHKYQLTYYEPDGTKKYSYIDDETATTNVWNILSRDERLSKIEWKDMPKGSLIHIGQDARGAYAVAIQHKPMKDNSELIFEGSSTSTSDPYSAVSEKAFDSQYTMTYGKVVDRISAGIVMNAHIPTEEEAANGGVFPMENWNRIIPLNSSATVILYDKSDDEIYVESADCILPGDMIFIKRSGETYNGVYVFRD